VADDVGDSRWVGEAGCPARGVAPRRQLWRGSDRDELIVRQTVERGDRAGEQVAFGGVDQRVVGAAAREE
jgi:hypothetical protein